MIDVDRGTEPVPFARHISLRVIDDGALEPEGLRRQITALLAEQPRALLCDLSAFTTASTGLTEVLRDVASEHLDWPGTPVGVACPDPHFQRLLLDSRSSDRFVVGASVHMVEDRLRDLPPADHATMTLEPGLTAPRSARAFVARACLDWQTLSVTGHACLVTSELVTNAVLHADTAVQLTISHCPGRLRIAVQDGDERRPAAAWPTVSATTPSRSGRGLLLVSRVCRAWGVHPADNEGRVVWAVLDDGSGSSEPPTVSAYRAW